MFSFNISFTVALSALRAAFDSNCSVEAGLLPACFPVEPAKRGHNAEVPDVVPRLHLGLWQGLQKVLRENRSSRSINRFPELPQVTFTKEDVHQNAALFECIAFKVVGFFLAEHCGFAAVAMRL